MRHMRWIVAVLVALLVVPMLSVPTQARADVDIYTTPGTHVVNGREWRTTCEPYSRTQRCRTEIRATTVAFTGGRFVQTTDWVFNNLTYAASPRSLWKGNPLAANGVVGGTVSWTAADGRKWRTECDTDLTGRNGCRSFIEASVIESHTAADGSTAFRWATKLIFNNMVRFSAETPRPAPSPTAKPSPTSSPRPSSSPRPTSSPSPTSSPTPSVPGDHRLTTSGTRVPVPGVPAGAEAVLVRVIGYPAASDVAVRHAGGDVLHVPAGSAASGTFLARVTDGGVVLSASSVLRVDVEPVAWFTADPVAPGSVVALAAPERRADTAAGEGGSALGAEPVVIGLVGKGGVPSVGVRQVFVTLTLRLDRPGEVQVGDQTLALPAGATTVSTVVTPSGTGDVEVSASGTAGDLVLDVRGYVVEAVAEDGRVNSTGSVLPALGSVPQTVTARPEVPAGLAGAPFTDAASQLVLVTAGAAGGGTRVSGDRETGTGLMVDQVRGAVPQLALAGAQTGSLTTSGGTHDLTVVPVAVVLGEVAGLSGSQPSLQVTSPAAGSTVDLAEELVEFSGTLTSATAVERIEIRSGGELIGHADLAFGPGGQEWSFRTAAPSSGTVTLRATVVPRAGAAASASRPVNIVLPPADAVVLNDEAVILGSADVADITASDDGSLTFASRPDLEPGQPIVGEPSSGAPDGFLRSVVAIDQIDGDWVVTTAPAALVDIILQSSEADAVDLFALTGADIDDSPAPRPGDTTGVTVVDEGITPISVLLGDDAEVGPYSDDGAGRAAVDPGVGARTTGFAAPLSADDDGGGFGIDETLTGAVGAEVAWSRRLGEDLKDTSRATAATRSAERAAVEQSGGVSVEASAQLSARLEVVLQISVEWTWGRPSPTVDDFSVVLETSARARAVLAAHYEARTTERYQRTVGVIDLPSITFYVNAPTPVPIVIDNTITLSVIGELEAEFSASVEYALQRDESYGFRYSSAGGIEQIHEGPTVTQRTPVFGENPNGRAAGTLDAWIALEAELSMLVYGYAGPVFSASIGPGIEAEFVADAATGALAASVDLYLQAGVSGRLELTVPIIDHQLLDHELFSRRWRIDVLSFTWIGDEIFNPDPGSTRPVPPQKDLSWARATRFGGGWAASKTSVVDRERGRVVVLAEGYLQEAPDHTYPFDAHHAWVIEDGVLGGLVRTPVKVGSAALVPDTGRVLFLESGADTSGPVQLHALDPVARTVEAPTVVVSPAQCERVSAETVWVEPVSGTGLLLGSSVTYPEDDDGGCRWNWQPEKREQVAWVFDTGSFAVRDRVAFDLQFERTTDVQFAPDGTRAHLLGHVGQALHASWVSVPLNGSLLEGPTALTELERIDSAAVDPRDGTIVVTSPPSVDLAAGAGEQAFASNLWRFDPVWGDLLEQPGLVGVTGQMSPGGVRWDYRGVTFDDEGRLFGLALDRAVIGSYDNGAASFHAAGTGEIADLAPVPSNVRTTQLWHYSGQQLTRGPGTSLLWSAPSGPTWTLTLPAETEATHLRLTSDGAVPGTELLEPISHAAPANCRHPDAGINDLCQLTDDGIVAANGNGSEPMTLTGYGDPIPLGWTGSPGWTRVLPSGDVIVGASNLRVENHSGVQYLFGVLRVDPVTRQAELLGAGDLAGLSGSTPGTVAPDGSLYFAGTGQRDTPDLLVRLEPDGALTTTPLRFQDTDVALEKTWNSSSSTSLWGVTSGPIVLATDGAHGFITNEAGAVARLDLATGRVAWISGTGLSERANGYNMAVTAAPDGGAYVVVDDAVQRLGADGRELWTRVLLPADAAAPAGPWGPGDAQTLARAVVHPGGVTLVSQPRRQLDSSPWDGVGQAWTISDDGEIVRTVQLPIPAPSGYTVGFQVEPDGRVGWWTQSQYGVVAVPPWEE